MTILWMTSSSVEHFVIEDSQILTLEKLWMGYRPQFDLRAYAFPTRGPTRSLRESPNRKWISENLALSFSEKAFVSLISLSSSYMNHTIQFACKIIVTHQEKTRVRGQNQTI